MRANALVLCGLLGLWGGACGSNEDKAKEKPKSAEPGESDTKATAPKPATKGAQYCDVRESEESPNYGTCWEYPGGFSHPKLCGMYRGTEAEEPCPKSGNYVGTCHHEAIHLKSNDGAATSTVSRDEFFVHQYDVKGIGGKFPAAKQAECEGEKGVWIPK